MRVERNAALPLEGATEKGAWTSCAFARTSSSSDRATGSDAAMLLESCGSAGMAGPARYLTTTKCPTQRVRDGLSIWLPTSYLTHLLATTLLVHAKPPLSEMFSLLLGASSP